MSRSKKKYAICHICYGDNSWYYRDARRHLRTMNKQEMRQLLARHDIELLDEQIMGYQNKHDTNYNEWNEPTDGSFPIADKNRKFYGNEYDDNLIEKLKRK